MFFVRLQMFHPDFDKFSFFCLKCIEVHFVKKKNSYFFCEATLDCFRSCAHFQYITEGSYLGSLFALWSSSI